MSKRKAKQVRNKVKARLKVFSRAMINTGKGPNAEVIAEYHARTKSLGGPEVPPSLLLSVGRQAAQELREKISVVWQGDRRQGIDNFHFTNLEKGKLSRLDLYFTGNSFFFVSHKFSDGFKRVSIIYSGRERAMQVYYGNHITYVERVATHDQKV